MGKPPSILNVPSIRDLFEGAVEPLWREDQRSTRLLIYASTPDLFGPSETLCTLGLLDCEKDLYFEVSFRGETIINCRRYTPDYFSHGQSVRQFRNDYQDLIEDRIPREWKQRLFGLFLPDDQGIDRHAGGLFLPSLDAEGHYRERCIDIENKYL